MADQQLSFPEDLNISTLENIFKVLSSSDEQDVLIRSTVHIKKEYQEYRSKAILELDEMGLLLKKDLLDRGIDLNFSNIKMKNNLELKSYTSILMTPENEGTLYFISLDFHLLEKLLPELWDIKDLDFQDDLILDAVSELANLLMGDKIILFRKNWGFLSEFKIPLSIKTSALRLTASSRNIYYKNINWGRDSLLLGLLS